MLTLFTTLFEEFFSIISFFPQDSTYLQYAKNFLLKFVIKNNVAVGPLSGRSDMLAEAKRPIPGKYTSNIIGMVTVTERGQKNVIVGTII